MLKQLMINKRLKIAKASLQELLEQQRGLQTRSEELAAAVEEANSDDEIATVEEEAAQLDTEQTELEGKKSQLEGEIQALEGELEELKSKEPTINPKPAAAAEERSKSQTGGEARMRGNKHETRAQMLERLNQPEVRDFYANIIALGKEKRSVSGAEVLVPDVVLNMIQTRIGDYSKLMREVTVEPLNGNARIILDGAIPEAIWTEVTDSVKELSDAFTDTELDGYKVGGFIPVHNSTLEDSVINLANFIEGRLAKAIAKAIDKAILTGRADLKMPTGIIPSVPDSNKVTSGGELYDIIGKMALLDDGEDGEPIDEVIAVMKRTTYYTHISPQTFLPTADGRIVVQSAKSPMLPDGTRIVFSQYAPADTIVMGDFKKYLLGERSGIKLATSTEVRFIEDQTVFKGTARYDGKPVYPDQFVVITIVPKAA
ncbi:phage major capsid protein [Paenibacillus sp. KR2-11]|uniref:phage major capsid protein n=1 Tax=Paenibacillus sp. KR2-11 TaxID=3385500 RepID=UPI0038FCC1E0